jgi:hypothetical protein
MRCCRCPCSSLNGSVPSSIEQTDFVAAVENASRSKGGSNLPAGLPVMFIAPASVPENRLRYPCMFPNSCSLFVNVLRHKVRFILVKSYLYCPLH